MTDISLQGVECGDLAQLCVLGLKSTNQSTLKPSHETHMTDKAESKFRKLYQGQYLGLVEVHLHENRTCKFYHATVECLVTLPTPDFQETIYFLKFLMARRIKCKSSWVSINWSKRHFVGS